MKILQNHFNFLIETIIEKASFDDIRIAFEDVTGKDLEGFCTVDWKTGAPTLRV